MIQQQTGDASPTLTAAEVTDQLIRNLQAAGITPAPDFTPTPQTQGHALLALTQQPQHPTAGPEPLSLEWTVTKFIMLYESMHIAHSVAKTFNVEPSDAAIALRDEIRAVLMQTKNRDAISTVNKWDGIRSPVQGNEVALVAESPTVPPPIFTAEPISPAASSRNCASCGGTHFTNDNGSLVPCMHCQSNSKRYWLIKHHPPLGRGSPQSMILEWPERPAILQNAQGVKFLHISVDAARKYTAPPGWDMTITECNSMGVPL